MGQQRGMDRKPTLGAVKAVPVKTRKPAIGLSK